MTAAWVINGWRQQERTPSAVCKALEVARARGMQSYNINRIGKSYWLVCSRDTRDTYDLAITVRRYYAKVKHGIYLSGWREQVVMIVWRNDTLQHCLACDADKDGIAHLQLLLERLTRKSRRHACLLLSTSVPESLHDYCLEHLAQWQLKVAQCEIRELTAPKLAKLRSVDLPTPWQQRQRALTLILLVLGSSAMSVWYLWPEQRDLLQEQARVQQALPDPQGVAASALQELPELFYGMRHLAGWHWRSASLNGQELRVQLQASYGRPAELTHQLNPGWQLEPQRQQVSAKYVWPTVPFARQQTGFSISELNTSSWQRRLKQFFPSLELRQGRTVTSTHYRQEVFTLTLSQTDFSELARLSYLLAHPHLRLVKMNLQAAEPLRAELDVHLYAPKPISTEGAS